MIQSPLTKSMGKSRVFVSVTSSSVSSSISKVVIVSFTLLHIFIIDLIRV